jgi:hypothetical protein
MRHTGEEVQLFARELPEDQRILLETSLWESARRVEEIKAGTAVTCSLAEVEADLRAVVGP